MRALLTIAWRNLWRNRRRTLINMSAVGLGLVLVIGFTGIMDGMVADAKNQMANTGMGHVEIYAPGFRGPQEVSAFMPDPTALLARLPLPFGSNLSWVVPMSMIFMVSAPLTCASFTGWPCASARCTWKVIGFVMLGCSGETVN